MSTGPTSSSDLEDSPYSITEDDLRERLNKRNWGRFKTQFQVGFTVAVGTMCFGMVIGWSGPQLKQQLNNLQNPSDIDSIALVASLVPLGCSFGSGVLSVLSHRYGPRKISLIISPPQCIIWIVISLTTSKTLEHLIMFSSGFFTIAYIVCGEKLLVDCVHSGYLNYFMLLTKLSSGFGILLAFAIGLVFDTDMYYSVINAGLIALEFFLLLVCPESPVFVYEKYPVRAENILKYLRGPTHIHEDLRQIKKDIESNNIEVSAKYMLFQKVVYKAIIKIAALRFFQAFSGYYAFLAYSIGIMYLDPLQPHKNHVFGQLIDGLIIGSVYFLSSFLCIIHYRQPFGVKKPLIVSSTLITVTLFTISLYTYAYHANVEFCRNNAWIQLINHSALIISYHIGLAYYPDFIVFAYLPQQVYHLVKTMGDSFMWLIIFVMVRMSIYFITSGGSCVLILAFISFCGIIFCSVFIFNSKNKSLLQIQMKLGGNPIGSRRRNNMYNISL